MTTHRAARPPPLQRPREHGVALVQVLLITGIIGLLMLQLALTARETGPEMARLLPLIGRAKAAARLRGQTA